MNTELEKIKQKDKKWKEYFKIDPKFWKETNTDKVHTRVLGMTVVAGILSLNGLMGTNKLISLVINTATIIIVISMMYSYAKSRV